MRRFLTLGVLVLTGIGHQGDAHVASSQTGVVSLELTQIEHRLVKAWLDGDRQVVDSLLASDWLVIDLTGRVLTKSQVMQELGSGDRKIESGAIDDLNIRLFGDTAVVTGRSQLVGSYQGKRARVTQRFTDVFVKRDSRWQVVASQGTQIAQSTTKQ